MSRRMCQYLVRTNDTEAAHTFLSWGWAVSKQKFVVPLGIEAFINHSKIPNCADGRALRDIQSNEEILEDYDAFDHQETWYIRLARRFGAWLPL